MNLKCILQSAAFVCASFAVSTCTKVLAIEFSLSPLGTYTGYDTFTTGNALNSSAQAVGVYSYPQNGSSVTQAIRWDGSNQPQILAGQSTNNPRGSATGINDQGIIVGTVRDPSVGNRAVMWTNPAAPYTDLGALVSYGSSSAAAINNNGQVVGTSFAGSDDHAFLWSPANGMVDLGTLPDGQRDSSSASAINQLGHITGVSSQDFSFLESAFLWTPAHGMVSLGPVPGGDPTQVVTTGINDSDAIIGYSEWAPFLWTPAHGMSILPGLPPYSITIPSAINDAGTIVGSVSNIGDSHGALWDANGNVYDLNNLLNGTGTGWTIIGAQAINDSGQILANAIFGPVNSGGSLYCSVILTPVPEPSSLALGVFAATILAIVARLHRSDKNQSP